MPAWSFQPRFRFALLNGLAEVAGEPLPHPGHGIKRQTIRTQRRDGRDPVPGVQMRLWIAQRTPARELLGTTPPIQRLTIAIAHTGAVVLDGRRLSPAAITALALRDRLAGARELIPFLEAYHGLPFAGYCFRW